MIRRLINWSLVVAFIWLVISRFSEINDFSQVLSKGHYLWIGIAVALEMLHYLVSSASYRAAFYTVGVESRLRDLYPLLFGSLFVNVVAPTGGASGAALFVDHAARHGQSTARTAAGILLQLVTSMVTFVVILIAGLAYLGSQNRLESYHLVAAGIFLLSIVALGGAFWLAVKRPLLLRHLLGWLQRGLNTVTQRIRRVSLISDQWIDQHLRDFIEAGAAITHPSPGLIWTMVFLLCAHLINIAVLYTLFLAFSESIPVGSLVAGYAVGILFLIVSVTPQGVGVVESIMPLVFGSLGVPFSIATITVLAFRGLTFWLPLVLGFLLLRRMDFFHNKTPVRAGR